MADTKTDVQAILKDKRVWAVAGVGGVAGLVILLKGKGNATGQASDAAGYGVQTSTGSTGGYYDSTSADIANQLGQYQTGIQTALGQYSADQNAALSAYQTQLTDSLSGLTTGQPSTPTTNTVLQYTKSWKSGSTYTLDSVARRFGVTTQALIDANAGRNVKSGIAKGATINIPITSTNSAQFNKG